MVTPDGILSEDGTTSLTVTQSEFSFVTSYYVQITGDLTTI